MLLKSELPICDALTHIHTHPNKQASPVGTFVCSMEIENDDDDATAKHNNVRARLSMTHTVLFKF